MIYSSELCAFINVEFGHTMYNVYELLVHMIQPIGSFKFYFMQSFSIR